jgi:hypothetical protein
MSSSSISRSYLCNSIIDCMLRLQSRRKVNMGGFVFTTRPSDLTKGRSSLLSFVQIDFCRRRGTLSSSKVTPISSQELRTDLHAYYFSRFGLRMHACTLVPVQPSPTVLLIYRNQSHMLFPAIPNAELLSPVSFPTHSRSPH